MKDIETVVSENIQKLLKEYNLSHARLAEIAGVSVSTVGKWVLKKATPRMGSIQKISDHFNLPKSYILKEESFKLPSKQHEYPFLPANISAGLPINVEAITDTETINLPDSVMGKWAGNKDILISSIYGDSMDKIMPDGSLIAIKPISLQELKDSDIVVFSTNGEYSVKYFYKRSDRLVFKPYSYNKDIDEQSYSLEENIEIHGKVVVYIVEMD